MTRKKSTPYHDHIELTSTPPPLVILLACLIVSLTVSCSPNEAKYLEGGKLILQEDFDNPALDNWKTGKVIGPASKGGGPRSETDAQGHWTVVDGHLYSPGERNQPLWLKTPLPDHTRIEFTAWTSSDKGDLKIEVDGNGQLHESGYILVFGGWNNTLSIIGRLDEHETDRIARPDYLEQDRKYKMAVVRTGKELRWYVDGRLYLRRHDRSPLLSEKNRYFAFNNWQSKANYDDLRVYDLTVK